VNLLDRIQEVHRGAAGAQAGEFLAQGFRNQFLENFLADIIREVLQDERSRRLARTEAGKTDTLLKVFDYLTSLGTDIFDGDFNFKSVLATFNQCQVGDTSKGRSKPQFNTELQESKGARPGEFAGWLSTRPGKPRIMCIPKLKNSRFLADTLGVSTHDAAAHTTDGTQSH